MRRCSARPYDREGARPRWLLQSAHPCAPTATHAACRRRHRRHSHGRGQGPQRQRAASGGAARPETLGTPPSRRGLQGSLREHRRRGRVHVSGMHAHALTTQSYLQVQQTHPEPLCRLLSPPACQALCRRPWPPASRVAAQQTPRAAASLLLPCLPCRMALRARAREWRGERAAGRSRRLAGSGRREAPRRRQCARLGARGVARPASTRLYHLSWPAAAVIGDSF